MRFSIVPGAIELSTATASSSSASSVASTTLPHGFTLDVLEDGTRRTLGLFDAGDAQSSREWRTAIEQALDAATQAAHHRAAFALERVALRRTLSGDARLDGEALRRQAAVALSLAELDGRLDHALGSLAPQLGAASHSNSKSRDRCFSGRAAATKAAIGGGGAATAAAAALRAAAFAPPPRVVPSGDGGIRPVVTTSQESVRPPCDLHGHIPTPEAYVEIAPRSKNEVCDKLEDLGSSHDTTSAASRGFASADTSQQCSEEDHEEQQEHEPKEQLEEEDPQETAPAEGFYIDDFSDYDEEDFERRPSVDAYDVDWTLGCEDQGGAVAWDQQAEDAGTADAVAATEASIQDSDGNLLKLDENGIAFDDEAAAKSALEEGRDAAAAARRVRFDEDGIEYDEDDGVYDDDAEEAAEWEAGCEGEEEEEYVEEEDVEFTEEELAQHNSRETRSLTRSLTVEIDDMSDYEDDEIARKSSVADLFGDVDWAQLAEIRQAHIRQADCDGQEPPTKDEEPEQKSSVLPGGDLPAVLPVLPSVDSETW